jgi:hypothetical protein
MIQQKAEARTSRFGFFLRRYLSPLLWSRDPPDNRD